MKKSTESVTTHLRAWAKRAGKIAGQRRIERLWRERRRVAEGVEEKWCSACREWWPLECFMVNAQGFDGRHWQCRACVSERRVDTKQNRMPLPSDYETCSECGFDHGYEYESAVRTHRRIEADRTEGRS